MFLRKSFVRWFLIAFAIQMVFYVFFLLWGTDSFSHGLNTFGNTYLSIYFIPQIVQIMDSLGAPGGLRAVNGVIELSPPLVALIYSVLLSIGILVFRQVSQKK